MTHEEIVAAIEQLRELGGDGCITNTDIIDAVFSGNNFKVRDALIDLLKQADTDRHMELPVDVDGVPIHVGDKMDCGERFGVQEVDGFVHGAVAFTVCDHQPARICTCPAHMTHHYHKPTVEDVLREFGDEVQRCCDTEDTIAEYAAKLREVMADDDAR